jgi:hypothetical protein
VLRRSSSSGERSVAKFPFPGGRRRVLAILDLVAGVEPGGNSLTRLLVVLANLSRRGVVGVNFLVVFLVNLAI